MFFIPKNPLSIPQINNAPSTPTGTRGLFAKEDGFYEVDSNGVVSKLCNTNNIKEDNTFVVNVINSEDNIVTADKTYQEILEAYNNGKIVIALLTDYSITTDGIIGKTSEFWVLNNETIAFSATFSNGSFYLSCSNDNKWDFVISKIALFDDIPIIDDSLSETSENPVQNKVATAELLKKATVREVKSTDSSLEWIAEDGEANTEDAFAYKSVSGGHAIGDIMMVVPINGLMPRDAYICTIGSYHSTTGYSYKYEKVVTPDYVENKIGDIETALDNIIAIQNDLIGGEAV